MVHLDTSFQFIGPDKDFVLIDSVEKCLEVADVILATGLPNYKMARIPIRSGLNLLAWGQYLADYPYQRLLQYLTFRFPLSIKEGQALSNHDVTNRFSARQFPDAILDYLHKEIKERTIVGPVTEINHAAFHCSPLLTRPKDVGKRRVIIDLSFPRGNAVNDFVDGDVFDGTQFTLRFSTVDDIAEDITACKDDPVLFKIDVACAFRNLRVDPADSLKLGIQWQGKLYLDVAIAFGWTLGTAAFQLCSDAIAFIMSKENVKLHCYIHDYVAVVPRVRAEAAFQCLRTLLHTLGLPVNQDKLTPPTKRLTCLGIEVDIEANVLRIAPDKLHAIHQECLLVRRKTHLTKKQFQSLLGKLLYIQKCVKPSRIFVSRMLALFRSHISGRIRLTDEFYQDLHWFIVFLPHFNGVTYISRHPLDKDQSLYLDACLTGMGAIWRNRVYATPVVQVPNFILSIVHLEMLNLVIALRTWASLWRHTKVVFHCDNMAVVHVVRTNKTRDEFLALCLRNIWLLAALHDMEIKIRHIRGKKNVEADTLSRIYSDSTVDEGVLSVLRRNYIWDHIPVQYFDLDLHL